ncbi:putative acyltransferase [Singulisphaera acidiphila DSM 18658]|uniref:Putative acyltransferase n=2 Tax=Singulisphaera acidiphila TaxID=466153 RepID=L0DQV6_SINAD|nr:putative acyltransferase [Singulisphaera acidiphila DSM 18658]
MSVVSENGSFLTRLPIVPELDALRGIGAIFILSYHLWPSPIFFGWTRADLFFVISGYLITSVVLKYGGQPNFLLKFWIRRALRTWPPYYTLLTILAIYGWGHDRTPNVKGMLTYACFIQNVPGNTYVFVWPFYSNAIQTWSLAVEEQFYWIWPPIIILTGRRFVVPIALLAILQAVIGRILEFEPYFILSRLDGLAFGSILAVTINNHERTRHWTKGMSLFLLSVGMVSFPLLSVIGTNFEKTIVAVPGCGPISILVINSLYFSIVGLTILHTGHPLLGLLRLRLLRYIGKISYGIFLYHLLIAKVVKDSCGFSIIEQHVLTVGLSFVAAIISWEVLERPCVSLKSLYPYEAVGFEFTRCYSPVRNDK